MNIASVVHGVVLNDSNSFVHWFGVVRSFMKERMMSLVHLKCITVKRRAKPKTRKRPTSFYYVVMFFGT